MYQRIPGTKNKFGIKIVKHVVGYDYEDLASNINDYIGDDEYLISFSPIKKNHDGNYETIITCWSEEYGAERWYDSILYFLHKTLKRLRQFFNHLIAFKTRNPTGKP